MAGQYNSICITGVAASVLEALGVAPRADMQPPIGALTQLRQCLLGGTADRALLYNPDAIAFWLYQKYTDLFTDAMCRSAVSLPMLSVMPSVTPVCFASMYTGITPDVHGIQAYEKPVLTVPTLFDALIAAGKKPAIVSTAGDSISVIFLNRTMDYFIYDTVGEVNAKAHELIEADRHDVIVVYNADYDAQMHRTGPESPRPWTACAPISPCTADWSTRCATNGRTTTPCTASCLTTAAISLTAAAARMGLTWTQT